MIQPEQLEKWISLASEVVALAAAIAALTFLGPLVGWWAHTVRPDVWACALETSGLVIFLHLQRRNAWLAVTFTAPPALPST